MKTSRKLLCMLLTLLMLVSLLPAAALAAEDVTVTVNVAPSTVSVSFFADAAAETAVDASAVTDNGTVKVGSYNYHQYVLTIEPGTYSYRGTDGDYVLGGEQFTVSEAATINLLRANIRYNGASLNQEGDYTFTLKNGENDVVCGTPYLTSNILYTPTLLIAGVKHDGVITLAEKWKDTFFMNPATGAFSNTPSKTTGSAATINLSQIQAYKMIRVTAPTAATTTFYKQDANYVVEPVTPDSTAADAEAGTTTYLFKGTAAHSNYQFRSMMPGKMTQAGYLADGNDITVSFSGDPNSAESAMAYDDNSVLLNIPNTAGTMLGQNKLYLEVGETFKLRAFRGAWEIINTSTGNQMIEPDFHAAILSGFDVVSIVPTTECTNTKFPNAGNGNATGNWMNVTALKKGTAVVAVWYDAINVYNANPPAANEWSVFGAAAPARYGVFVVSVGDDNSITWNPVSHDGDWDAEFDVVYYNGDAGCFTFAPDEDVTGVTVQNVYGTTLGAAQTVEASADGSYAVPVTTGANIIAVTTADGTDYQVVRAKKISYTITNNTTGASEVNGAPAISTEDSVTISFDKLDMPIPKMSGIYNPGYLGTAKTACELNDSLLLTSAGTQYDFSAKNSVTFIAHVAGENSLKGYISLSSMGDPFGNHRNITDDGKPVNTNAAEVFGDFGVLPDITFTATDNGAKASYEDATKITSLTVKGANSTGYLTGFTNWTKVEDGNSNWTAETSAMTAYTLTANVKTKDYNNKLQLRYWYDGEKVQTADLIAGATNTINGFTLDANKILNLQVVITPADPTLGDAKTYTYLVYPGKSNLQYVHPVIKSLTAKNGDETLVMKPVLNTADTAYTLCVGDAEKISLSGEQLIKIYNTAVTADQSDSVVLTKMKDGSPVGDSITILEAGAPTNPNRYWACDELDITDADALRIVVTSYVDNANARTYTFTLDRIAGSENEKKAQAVDALIDAIGEVTPESETDITAAREAYEALTPEQQALVTKLGTLTDAESALAELKKPPLPPIIDDGDDTITVTFRLIGSTKASSDVDLSKGTEGYNGAEYVTWIKTTTYTLEKGSTVGDLFAMALDEADLDCVGLENNYISAITAPVVCGGYVLAEMDNGLNSGWMYTVNGSHPGRGLNDRVLSNGDRVIWHYVDDYAYEVKDWPDGSSGDSSIWNRWLKAADVTPEAKPEPEEPAEPEDPVQPDEEPAQEETPVCFEDVPEGTYYTDAVDWAVENGITTGTDDTHFSPDAPCDRAQTVTFLWRAAGCPEPKGTENPFTDLDETAYYYKAVLWAVENGITKGTSATTFSPEKPVTRAQAVTFLYRFAKGRSDGENPFTDVKNGEYYTEAVNWAVAEEITNGTSATTFSPDADCVRAQIVTFLYRYFA